MRKKIVGISLLSLITGASFIICLSASLNKNSINIVKGDPTSYSLLFDKDNNKLTTSDSFTSGNKDIGPTTFIFTNIKSESNSWQTLNASNSGIKNNLPIHGLTNISITTATTTSFDIKYGFGESISLGGITLSGDTSYSYNFDNTTPSYFSISNASDTLSIVSMSITYSCDNTYYGQTPLFIDSNQYVIYGMYPYSQITNNSLISTLDSHKGVDPYITYGNDYYYFYNSNWYNVEPIKWRVLDNADGYLLLSEYILDNHRFDDDSSDYSTSEIRDYLLNDFYDIAFGISDTYINKDNDKISLLSQADYMKTSYGFTTNGNATSKREASYSDFAVAKGIKTTSNQKGPYWTQTKQNDVRVYYCSEAGQIGYIAATTSNYGIRPAVKINL